MPDIDHYCRVYDHFLEASDCDEYVEKFEETITVDAERHRELSVCYREDGSMICGQCDCMRTNPMEYPRFHDLNIKLMDKWMEAVERYKEDCGINKFEFQWPKQYGWEELRIKKFRVDSEKAHGLELHSDVYSYAHAKRFLCLMVYLNDDFTDGETFFPLMNSKVEPKKGRLFIFPPSWNYLHQGIPPQPSSNRNAKYFIMTHLVYVDKDEKVNVGVDFSDRTKVARDEEHAKLELESAQWPTKI